MNNFVFQNPVKVYFGKGQIDNLSAESYNKSEKNNRNQAGNYGRFDLAGRKELR